MKKIFLEITMVLALFLTMGCGTSDDGFSGKNDDDGPITVDPGTITIENVHSFMVDANATNETVALFYNLKKLSKTKYIVGHQDAFNGFYNDAAGSSDMKKATGSDPGMLGSDFMFITDDQNDGQPGNWFYQQEQIITGDAIEAYDKGMVNIFCWHLREPYNGETFYAEDIEDDFQRQNALRSILPGGENHTYYKEKLDKVADVLNNLHSSDGTLIPVIFRPFHEFDGNWFWWGASYCTPEEYKQAFQFTVEYLRDTKQVRNVLYAWSPDNSYTTENQYLSRYPGDDYVDIIGMDNYGDFGSGSAAGVTNANIKLKMVSDIARERVKVAAMTETGFRVTAGNSPIDNFFSQNIYTALTSNDIELAFVMFWANNNDGYYVPPSGQADTQDFINFTNKGESVLQNELPKMYMLASE